MKKEEVKKQQNNIGKAEGATSIKEASSRGWYLVDARNQILGRLATRVAKLLMGKDKVAFARYKDMGDSVVIVNSSKVAVSGAKEQDKKYYRYSGYPGGLKETTLAKLREKKPEELIYHAVSGMLPKNRLGKSIIKNLYVYPKDKHSHEAQKPQEVEI
ncbi:MAG: 50S ribosomal protein L13 [Candidatus Woykebacteria bacterium]